MGTLTVETTGKEVSFMTGGEERGVARSEGTLVNFAQIVNHGEIRAEADTHLYNLWLQNGGTLTLVDALYLGWDSPSLGYGAAVTLQGRAAMALADESTPMSNGMLTLEDSAVYSFVNSNKTLSLKNMEIVLKDSAALMLGGGTAQLEGCTLTLGSGAQAHLESSQTLLYGCSFTVGEGSSFYVGNSPVRLSAGTVIANRGYMDIHMTGADRLQIDGGASIVNNGELYLALGMDDPQEFIRSGAIVNHGTLHTDT